MRTDLVGDTDDGGTTVECPRTPALRASQPRVGEGQTPMVATERSNHRGLDSGGIGVRGLTPRDEKIAMIGELPDASAT